jgi:hypothetical protein
MRTRTDHGQFAPADPAEMHPDANAFRAAVMAQLAANRKARSGPRTLAELFEDAGLDAGKVKPRLYGHRPLPLETAQRIAETLGIGVAAQAPNNNRQAT